MKNINIIYVYMSFTRFHDDPCRIQKQLQESLNKILKLSQKKRKFSGFTIGNTSKIDNKNYYFTPLRDTEKIVFSGIVLYSEHLAKIVAKYVEKSGDPKVDNGDDNYKNVKG